VIQHRESEKEDAFDFLLCFSVFKNAMRVTRIFADAAGESHFGEIDHALHDHGDIGRLSEWLPATKLAFRETGADYDYDWHNAPRRQFIIMLDGHIEIEVSAGEVREFAAGDVILLEDTTGKGHRTRELSGKPRRSIFVALD
jgi:hypothetical protein